MPSPQDRHRPRRSIHEITGMLSRFAISAPQLGHRDLGRTTLSPAGTRETTTVMKLPTASPNGRAINTRTQRSLMGRPYLPQSLPSGVLAHVGDVLLEPGDLTSAWNQHR